MTVTKFELCTNALVQIGAKAITDFAGATRESEVCGYLYQPTVDNWLSMYPWRFATKQVVLSRDVTVPETIWAAMYSQPAGMISLQAVTTGGKNIPFDRYENKIYCNAGAAESVVAIYVYAITETYWPPYFVELMEAALMHKLAFSLPAKLDLRASLEDLVITKYRMAKSADERQQTSRKLPVTGRRSIMEARRA